MAARCAMQAHAAQRSMQPNQLEACPAHAQQRYTHRSRTCKVIMPRAHASPVPPAPRLPSVRRARPPVGVHSTVEQLPHSTTVWECENTVVLQSKKRGDAVRDCAARAVAGDAPPHCRRGTHHAAAGRGNASHSHLEAALALHVHEERVGRLYQALELVLRLLKLRRGVQ